MVVLNRSYALRNCVTSFPYKVSPQPPLFFGQVYVECFVHVHRCLQVALDIGVPSNSMHRHPYMIAVVLRVFTCQHLKYFRGITMYF